MPQEYLRFIYLNEHPPHLSELVQRNQSTSMLANCKSIFVPQNIYSRLGAWKSISTSATASNLSLQIIRASSTHHFISEPHWFVMQFPWEREGFSKTDSTQYCNFRYPRTGRKPTFKKSHQCTKLENCTFINQRRCSNHKQE